jgi:hypothetical protein
LSAYVSRFQHGVWRGPQDTTDLIERVKQAVDMPDRRPRATRQRTALIERVRGDWIRGILEKSLYQTARIELEMVLDPRPLSRGLDVVIQRPDESPTPLAPGTRLVEVFDDHRGQLLILGAPGAGKTTLLLELARELLDRAVVDEEHPIPVVFNLSSWALERRPLDEWMISELVLRSDAPKKLAREWVTNEQILPLLDGLDEVAPEHRHVCLSAINSYRAEHGWVSCAVCSRTAEYEALAERLSLPGAVVVQPLDREQIIEYVTAAGATLSGVREALETDERLFELLETPLMLSIVALAYKHSDRPAAPTGAADVFERYVDGMFRRRRKETRYPEDRMRAWLQWLAANLVQRGQTVVFLEDVVPEWFLGNATGWLTAVTIVITSVGSSMWLVGLHQLLYALDPSSEPFAWWSMVLVSGPIAVVLAAWHGRRAGPVEALRFHFPGWKAWTAGIVRGVVLGFIAGYVLLYSACVALMDTRSPLAPIRDPDAREVVMTYAIMVALILAILFGVRGLITQRMGSVLSLVEK